MSNENKSPKENQPLNEKSVENTPKLDVETYLRLVNMITTFLNENKGFHKKPDIHQIGIFIADILHTLEEKIRGEITEKLRAELTEQIQFQLKEQIGDQLESGKIGNVEPKQKKETVSKTVVYIPTPQKKPTKHPMIPVPQPKRIPNKEIFPTKRIYWGISNDWLIDEPHYIECNNEDRLKAEKQKRKLINAMKEHEKTKQPITKNETSVNNLLDYNQLTKQFKMNKSITYS